MARSSKKKKGATQDFDPTRWAHAVFMLGAALAMWMFAHLTEDVWAFVWSQWPQAVPRPTELQPTILGVVLGAIVGVWGWRREKYFKFVCEVAIEVSQIIWPTRSEVRAATVVVVTITLICSGLLWGMDTVWSTATDFLYGL